MSWHCTAYLLRSLRRWILTYKRENAPKEGDIKKMFVMGTIKRV
jgi:hypothetical protein